MDRLSNDLRSAFPLIRGLSVRKPVSGAAMTLHPDLNLGFMWGGGTLPEFRGQGAFTALVEARIKETSGRSLTDLLK